MEIQIVLITIYISILTTCVTTLYILKPIGSKEEPFWKWLPLALSIASFIVAIFGRNNRP